MARIRTVKPEFWTSEQVVECSPTARLLFIGMWNFCDDGGVIPYSPLSIKMKVFPGDACDAADIGSWMSELERAGLIQDYQVDGRRYLKVTGWSRHQKIDKPTYRHPQPLDEGSTRSPRDIDEASPPEGKGREGKGREGKVKEYIYERKVSLPKDFAISERVEKWAEEKGHQNLDEHLESFRLTAEKGDYKYKNWCSAFMEAIRNDWAKLGGNVRPEDDPYHGAIQ